jgi:hypothetical protein
VEQRGVEQRGDTEPSIYGMSHDTGPRFLTRWGRCLMRQSPASE